MNPNPEAGEEREDWKRGRREKKRV